MLYLQRVLGHLCPILSGAWSGSHMCTAASDFLCCAAQFTYWLYYYIDTEYQGIMPRSERHAKASWRYQSGVQLNTHTHTAQRPSAPVQTSTT